MEDFDVIWMEQAEMLQDEMLQIEPIIPRARQRSVVRHGTRS